jgi:predicted transcriptional regulator of viral defense system
MTRTITELGPREAEFLAMMAAGGHEVFTFEKAAGFWGGGQYARNSLATLERKGWLERLERGRYMLVPLEAGTDRAWSEDPLAIGAIVAPDGAAAYWTAVAYRGWTTQLPRVQTFLTPSRRFRKRVTMLGVPYRFIEMRPERLFGITAEIRGGLQVRVTDHERTVLDALDRPDLCGGIAEVTSALATAWSELDLVQLTRYMKRFGSGTVPKRLGYLAEWAGLADSEPWLDTWHAMTASGITLLDRGGPATGPIVKRWNLRVNASGFSRSVET